MPVTKIMLIRHAEKPSDDGSVAGPDNWIPKPWSYADGSVRVRWFGSLPLFMAPSPTSGWRHRT